MSTSKNTGKKVAADSTASRAELDAISTTDAAVVDAFIGAARNRVGGFHTEASAYVAAVAARGGKRGSDAAVQRVIAAGLTRAGLASEVYSHARYSKLSGAFHAVPKAGLDSTNPEHYGALYALWNVPTAKESKAGSLTTAERDEIVTSAARSRTPEARVQRILKATADAKKKAPKVPTEPDVPTEPEQKKTDAPTEPPTDAPTDAPKVPTLSDLTAAIVGIVGVAEGMPEADRIAIVHALRVAADSLSESVVPSDASSLTLRDAA